MSREVIDLTRVDDDAGADAAAARRAAKRARRAAAASAAAGAEVIDLARDDFAGAAGGGRSGRVRAPFSCACPVIAASLCRVVLRATLMSR
jgi:hypothetical protein